MNNDIFTLDGLQFRMTLEPDDCAGAPWEENDGHGPVSDWRPRDYRGHIPKGPGERVLCADRHAGRVYDIAEAQRIALRDGWGLAPQHRLALSARLGREPTRREIAAAAVERDFDYLWRWCDGDWYYCVLGVELLDVDGAPAGPAEYLGGIESNALEYIEEEARELAARIAETLGPVSQLPGPVIRLGGAACSS